MSTKLYYGLIAQLKSHDIKELQNKLLNLQSALKDHIQKSISEYFDLKKKKEVSRFLLDNSKRFFPFSIGFWALDRKEGLYLAYPFYPEDDIFFFNKFIEKCDWLREYGYWDNSDMPEDMSNEEWNQRRIDWEEVIKYDGRTFGESMLIFDLTSQSYFPFDLLKNVFGENK